MENLFFWNRWQREHRYLYLFLLGIFTLSLLCLLISMAIGDSAVIGWEVASVMEPFMVTVDKFTHNLFDFSVDVESYVLKENFYASDVKVHLLPAYIFIGFLAIAVIFGIVITTFLESFSYFIGTAMLMLLVVTLNLDLLGIFNLSNKIPAGFLIVVLGGLSYFFKAFKPNATFIQRVFTFVGVLVIVGLVISSSHNVPTPVLYLTNFGITVPIILTLLFIIINGFEIINLLLYVSAGSTGVIDNKNRIFSFLFISVLYISNILLILLKKMLIIDWNILYINAFYLFIFSSIIGIWGYKKRAVTFKEMIPFNPLGGLFYLSLGIIANATIAYAFITANDPLVECFEYGIIYAHVFFGIIYFLYVLINFTPLFFKKISIYDIVYKPLNMPLFMVRGIGGAGILAIFFYSKMFAFYLGLAGYFNLAGDVYKHENNVLLAKQYYISGMQYEFQNHRSNYSLAEIYKSENNRDAESEFLSRSLIKRPYEYSYVNLSNLYFKENSYFHSMFILKEALEKFPNSPYIANNLAVLYTRTNLVDSVFYYLNQSLSNYRDEATPATNLIYTLVKKNLASEVDTLLSAYKIPHDNESFQNNKLLLDNIRQINSQKTFKKFGEKETLRPVRYAHLYNLGINDLKSKDQAFSSADIDSLIKNPLNDNFGDGLQLLKILKLYYGGNKKHAFELLENIKNTSTNTYFSKISAIWMLEQQAFLPAEENFFKTIQSGGPSALLNYCMALCEQGKFEKAESYLQDLQKINQQDISNVAAELLDISKTKNVDSILKWDEIKKLRFIHLRKNTIPENQLVQIFESIKSENIRDMALAEVVFYISKNKVESAIELFKNNRYDDQNKTYADGQLNLSRLHLLELQEDWKRLQLLSKTIYLNHHQENLRTYYNAVAAEGLGLKEEAAKFYDKIIIEAPYYEKGIIASVLFNNKINKTTKGYDIIADAVQFNPTSLQLLKLYALQALANNLESYGEDVLKQLKVELPAMEYETFRKSYLEQKAKMDAINAVNE